jgi:hypothetical protein
MHLLNTINSIVQQTTVVVAVFLVLAVLEASPQTELVVLVM